MKTYNWDDVIDRGDGKIFINNELYGIDTEFYDDIDMGKIQMIDTSPPDPETKHFDNYTTWLERES